MQIILTNNNTLKTIGDSPIIYDKRLSTNKNLLGLVNYSCLVIYDSTVNGTVVVDKTPTPKLEEQKWYNIEILDAFTDFYNRTDESIDLATWVPTVENNYLKYKLDNKIYVKRINDKAKAKLLEKFEVDDFSKISGLASMIMNKFDIIDEKTKEAKKVEAITFIKSNFHDFSADTYAPEFDLTYTGEIISLVENKQNLVIVISCDGGAFEIKTTVWKFNKAGEVRQTFARTKTAWDLGFKKVLIKSVEENGYKSNVIKLQNR